ncbi:LOW QUALITY PROTEIN: dystroglycan-like [Octopus sinensis]|uniref:Dystroglycan 1 n=1 Tax=Octopus sinensis TaxID=2607531 RepID=A0A7E6FIZ8_9MOLL|nr:LOW QUALITY PROTEIN: dystroglycan-like [Octopus sinensis]
MLLLPATSSATHMAPHRRHFLSPLCPWMTLILCIALLMQPTFALEAQHQQQQPADGIFNMERDVGAPPPAPVAASMQLKLNDIQSYLKSLDKSKKGEANHAATTTAATASTTAVHCDPVSLMWGIGDTTAYVGRLFAYPLRNDVFKGDIKSFKVMEAGKTTLPKWLYFDVETRTFSGVPKPADIAQYYIEVVAQAEDQGAVSQFAKDVFSIHVTKESSKPATAAAEAAAISGSSSKKNSKGSNSPPVIRCMPQEPETAFTLIVDADLDQLPPHGIVELLKKLEHNLELVSEMFKVGPATTGNRPIPPVHAVTPDTSSSSTLVSGPGDTKIAKHPGVLVTWLVGCGRVELQHMNVLQRVESISANGTLSELLGHGVVGWHVTNRQVTLPEKRVRRAAIMATPAVTDIAPTRTHLHSHKTHHRHTDGMAISMPEYCSRARKLKPRIAHRIPVQEFEVGKRAYFSVPSDTFIDCKVPSDRLMLAFFLKQLPPNIWLQRDPANNKSIIGLPMESNVGILNVTVVAINSDGMFNNMDFLVKVLKNKNLKSNKVTHKIKMKFSMEYKKFMSNLDSRLNLIDKIGKLYGDADASSVTVLEITEGSVEVSWTNNTLVGTKCPDDATNALFERLVDQKAGETFSKESNETFQAAIGPNNPDGSLCWGLYQPNAEHHNGTMAAATTPELKKPQSDDENVILISTIVLGVTIVSILLLALLITCIRYRKSRRGKMSLSSAGEGTQLTQPDRRRGGHRRNGGVNEPILGSQPCEPPPPVTVWQGKKQPRPHMQPPYTSPPPYVPP